MGMDAGVAIRVLVFILPAVLASLLYSLDYDEYRNAMERGEGGGLTRFFRESQYRITNRETAYVVARQYLLHGGSPDDAEALLPASGPTPYEENLAARIKAVRGDSTEAHALYQKAFVDSGNRLLAPILGRAFYYLTRRDFAEARQYLLQMEKFFPLQGDILLVKAVVLFLLGDGVNAEIALNAGPLFSENPADKARYYQLYSLFLEGRGDIEKALRYSRLALSFAPSDPALRLKIRILEANDSVAPAWWKPESWTTSPKKAVDEDDDGLRKTDFLTDRQIQDKLVSISKLIDQKNWPLAWERLGELGALNSLLYERDLLFHRSRIALAMGRPDLARDWLSQSFRKSPTPTLKSETMKILQLRVEEDYQNFETEKKRLADFKLSLPPADQAIAILEKAFPPASLLPIPDEMQKKFFINAPSPYDRIPGFISNAPTSNVSEAKASPLPPRTKRRYRLGELTEQISYYYSYGDPARLTNEICRGPGNETLQETSYRYSPLGQLSKKIVTAGPGLTNLVVEYQWTISNSHPRTFSLQDGRLLEYSFWTNQGLVTALPGREILQTENTTVSNTNVYRRLSANGSLIWTEVLYFPDDRVREEEVLRKELRSVRGDLIEYTLFDRKEGRIWRERRFRADHSEIETTVFEW